MTDSWDPGYGPLIDTRMRVATWNVWGRYGPWEERQPIIEANLRAIDADIICLQEAWEDDTRSQPAALAAALGMSFVYERAFMMNGGWSGNAVLSRWPILRHEVDELPMEGGGAVDTDEGERRLIVFTEIDGPRGPLQVFCTHLSWRADWSGVRQAQVRRVCEVVRAHTPRAFPAILCGDLNAEPMSDEIRMLTGLAAVPVPGVIFRDAWAAGAGPDSGSGATVGPRNPYGAAALEPDARIDYVLVGWPKLGGVGQVLMVAVAGDLPGAEGRFGSDHFAVAADLRY
jgi:endonuclease/exonuclease/phosphatase family metal-dependent hydrolase